MTSDDSDRELLLHRDVPYARELVWQAITDPAHMPQWWGPDGFTVEGLAMDLRVGGTWTFDMIGPDGTRFPNHSVFTEVTPPSKLAYDQGDGERIWFKATILLDEIDEGTRVTIHQVYPDRRSRDEVVEKYGAIEGGRQHLAKLEQYVADHLV